MIHVPDTHALTRYIEDYRRLGPAGRAIFDDDDALLIVPTIVLAEARFYDREEQSQACMG